MLLRVCLCSIIAVALLQAQSGRGGNGVGGGSVVFGGTQLGRQPGQPSGPPPPPPPSDCAVSGTVVNALTGEPIPRAMVSLGGNDSAGSATDATGNWSISNTACIGRAVNATRLGFINSQIVRNASGGRPTMVNLVSGSPVTGVKISLMPESSITGKVQDPNGDPVESARVQALTVRVQAGQRVLTNSGGTATDSQGNFRIGGLQPGRYVICAGSPEHTYPVGGGPAMAYQDDCYPGPAVTGISIAMPVQAGAEVRTALTLRPVEGVHVRGRVSGLPSANTRGSVQLMKLPRNMGIGSNLFGAIQEDGTFDIRTVLPGSYVAVANFQTNPPNPQQLTVQAPVDVGNSDVDNVALTFQPPGSLSGTVHYQFSNPATAANPPVNVNLRPGSNDAGFFVPIPQAQWDSDHLNFTFANVQPASELRLNANVNGREVYIKSATLRGQDVIDHPFTVEGAAGPVDIVVSDDTGGIDITANDSDGHPATDAVIVLEPTAGQRRILSSGNDGHATQKNLPIGDYRAWAFDSLATVPYAEEEWMKQNAGAGENVSVTSGGSATLTVKVQPAPKE